MADIAVAVASNDDEVLAFNLMRSPMIETGDVEVHVERNPVSASIAYNTLLDRIEADYVIFAHQDVYFPFGWEKLLRQQIEQLTRHDPNWALLGPYGVAMNGMGIGPMWASSLGSIVGRVPSTPVKVQCYDELVIILRKSSGLRFDEKLPHFHMYGMDIVQTAAAANMSSYVMSIPVVHNDKFHAQLDKNFEHGYKYVQKKWSERLPVSTPIVRVSWHGLHLTRARWINRRSEDFRNSMTTSTKEDPRTYAALCGWNDLAPR